MKNYTKDKKETIKIRLNSDLKVRYFNYCKNNGYQISEKIREYIERELENEQK